MSHEQEHGMTPAEVNAQINQYLDEASIHRQGSMYGNGGDMRSQNIVGGHVDRRVSVGVGGAETTHQLQVHDAEGNETRVSTWQIGDLEPNLHVAQTSKDGTKYWAFESDAAGVVRTTEDGREHSYRFKDPAKVEKASKLITSLASKRAARIISGNQKSTEKAA